MVSSEGNGRLDLDTTSASALRLSGELDKALITPVVAPRVLDDPVVAFEDGMAIADGEDRMVKICRVARAIIEADNA
jgi:hypothetical protein